MAEWRAVVARAAPEAAARIGDLRAAHLAVLAPLAAAGRVRLAVPLMDAAGAYGGSLVLLEPEALDGYLAAEPFRAGGVWADYAVHPFRLAALPWRALPSGPSPTSPTHAVAIAWDGTDAGAPDRRMANREAHFQRVWDHAKCGMLTLGGALLDAPGGRMAGSVAITAHSTVEAAKAWWAEDPYVVGRVWRDIAWHATRFAPLPYRPLSDA